MAFQKQLLEVGQALGQDEMKALVFLCTDLLRRSSNKIESFNNLFSDLMDQGYLSAEHPELLTELLLTIQQTRLLRRLGLSDQDYAASNLISSYRKLLYELSEDINADELDSIKFILNKTIPRRKLENFTTLEVFQELERLDHVNESSLSQLEDIFKSVCPMLNERINQYKAQTELGRPRSSSLPSVQSPRSLTRTGSLEKAGVHPLSLMKQCSMDSSSSPNNVGQEEGGNVKPQEDSKPASTQSADVTVLPKEFEDLETYPMTAAKRGHCVIFNNYDFTRSKVFFKNRPGTEVDEVNLQKVFEWLGFDVKVYRDCTTEKMRSVLYELSQRNHKQMDCMVCCILSHGSKGNVYGVDGVELDILDVTGFFDGQRCPTLVNKPKLFFIQACQGKLEQSSIDTDSRESFKIDIESDSRVIESIPDVADFLLGMATVPSYVSYRERKNGTWYIQSLCQNITQMVPRGIDLISILTKVNADVSKKTDRFGQKKQMPQPAFSLRKRVVFPIPETPLPDLNINGSLSN